MGASIPKWTVTTLNCRNNAFINSRGLFCGCTSCNDTHGDWLKVLQLNLTVITVDLDAIRRPETNLQVFYLSVIHSPQPVWWELL